MRMRGESASCNLERLATGVARMGYSNARAIIKSVEHAEHNYFEMRYNARDTPIVFCPDCTARCLCCPPRRSLLITRAMRLDSPLPALQVAYDAAVRQTRSRYELLRKADRFIRSVFGDRPQSRAVDQSLSPEASPPHPKDAKAARRRGMGVLRRRARSASSAEG